LGSKMENGISKMDHRETGTKNRSKGVYVRRACASFFCLSVSHRFYLLFSIFYLLVFPIGTAQAQEWQEVKSEHFIVYYSDDKKFAKKVSRQSEIYYRKIASELGYQRYSEFWTWDNRVKIYIHPSRESFLKATNQPKWSEGVANYTKKEISSYALSDNFLDALLPHEMTHLIFRDYVGFKGEVPLWLDEGVAQWMEPRKRELVKSVVARLADQGTLLSLQRMMTEDIRNSQDSEFVGVYYVQAVSLVSFLVTKYSAARFTNFCRQLRDGKSIEESLTFAYPTSIRSIKELEKKWKEYIKEE